MHASAGLDLRLTRRSPCTRSWRCCADCRPAKRRRSWRAVPCVWAGRPATAWRS